MFLLERLVIVGWVQLIPREAEYLRLLLGLIISILYLAILLHLTPYKRDDLDNFASILQACCMYAQRIVCTRSVHGLYLCAYGPKWARLAQRCEPVQVLLVLLFTASQTVYLFRQQVYIHDTESAFRLLGFRSLETVVALMVGFNLVVLIAFATMLLVQAFAQPTASHFRLVTSRESPELTLAKKMRYHLFLSHVGYGRSNLSTQHGTDKSPMDPFALADLEQRPGPGRRDQEGSGLVTAGHRGLP